MDSTSRSPLRRYKVNPVELAIFSVVGLIVVNSLYHLIREGGSFSPDSLGPLARYSGTDAIPGDESARALASTPIGSVDVDCGKAGGEKSTGAEKVRLSGMICGLVAGSKLLKTVVQNTATQYTATVFSDEKNARFSTDYIPLIAGRNPMTVEFQFVDGTSESASFVLKRD